MPGRFPIGSAPSGENTSLTGTEKVPLSGNKFTLTSTIAAYIRTLTQTLTNKTINLSSNTLTGTTAEFNTALSDGNFATIAGNETLTSKTLTAPTIADFTNMAHDHQDADDGGTLAEAALALTDITTNNSSTAKHGFLKKLDNDAAHFMDGQGNWSTPSVSAAVATDAIWDAKGDLAGGTGANTAARLAVGTNGFVLTADSAETTGMKWAAAPGGGVATDSIWDAKGDIAGGTGANTAAVLTVGANGTYLTADSAQTTGLKWTNNGVPSGTSFPGSPATNDLYFRTDRGLVYYYDGTRWLTTTLYEHHLAQWTNISATTEFHSAVWTATYDVYVVDLIATMYSFSGLSGTAYWTLNLYYYDGGTQGSVIASVNNQSGTNDSFVRKSASINALMGTAKDNINLSVAKTSTPGNAFGGAFLTYRLVG